MLSFTAVLDQIRLMGFSGVHPLPPASLVASFSIGGKQQNGLVTK